MLSNDANLFHLIANGDEKAFTQIYKTYTLPLYVQVKRITRNSPSAHDLVQEVFVKVWEKREQLTAVDNPASWLFSVAGNVAISHLRHLRTKEKVAGQIGKITPYRTVETSTELRQLRKLLQTAIDLLPGQQKKAFLLFSEEGLTRRQIAERMDISEHSVRNHLAQAKSSLREYLLKYSGSTLPLIVLLPLQIS